MEFTSDLPDDMKQVIDRGKTTIVSWIKRRKEDTSGKEFGIIKAYFSWNKLR